MPVSLASQPATKMRSNALVNIRARMVTKWMVKLRSVVNKIFARQTREAAARVLEYGQAVDEAMRIAWADELYNAQRPYVRAIYLEGFEQAGRELGVVAPKAAKKVTEVAVGPFEDLVQERQFERVDGWLKKVSTGSTNVHANRLNEIQQKAAREVGSTVWEISQEILVNGLAKGVAHARMIAQTNTVWSFNEGAMQRYISVGVAVQEWMTSKDDLVCPFCAALDGVRVATGDAFLPEGALDVDVEGAISSLNLPAAIEHPPLHPNCACVLLPVTEEVLVPTT